MNYPVLLKTMLDGAIVSLEIFGLTILFALPLGLLICLGRMSKYAIIRIPVMAYLQLMRGTPLMLQLFFFCYGPFFLFGFTGNDRFVSAIIAFSLNYAAYFAEIYRSGINSIGVGQYEAAGALGFTRRQTFQKIILPQVVKRILPTMGNEFMTLVKDTSLARVIAIVELFRVAEVASNSEASVAPLIVAAVFYLVMNTVVGQAFRFAEKKLDYYR